MHMYTVGHINEQIHVGQANEYVHVGQVNVHVHVGQVHGVHIDTQRDDQLKSEMDTLDMPDGAGVV